MEALAVLLRVTDWVTAFPTGTDPKLRVVGDALRPPPGIPVPVAEIVTVALVEVTKVKVAVCVRNMRGAYTTFKARLCPGAKL